MSFVRTADDMRELRWLLRHWNGDAALIAKIEKAEAIANFDAILEQSDGIMVARGDLGVETPAEAGAGPSEEHHPALQRSRQAGHHGHADAPES